MKDKKSDQSTQDSACGLATRNVFLDTEIYRGYGHNLDSAPMKTFSDHLKKGRFNLHITDITLNEIRRQICEETQAFANEVGKTISQMDAWRKRAPKIVGQSPSPIDVRAVSDDVFKKMESILTGSWSGCWNAIEHKATAISAKQIFKLYFQRKQPFAGSKSKEFPDAFVVASLEKWCSENNSKMYVVTADKAMRAAAEESKFLIPIESLDILLQQAVEAETPDIIATTERILDDDSFLETLKDKVEEKIKSVGLVYEGDLMDGEAYEAEVLNLSQILDFLVISSSTKQIEIIAHVSIDLLVHVQYEDTSDAMWDSEDKVYIGTEVAETEIETDATIKVFVSINSKNNEIGFVEFITREIRVSEPYETYK